MPGGPVCAQLMPPPASNCQCIAATSWDCSWGRPSSHAGTAPGSCPGSQDFCQPCGFPQCTGIQDLCKVKRETLTLRRRRKDRFLQVTMKYFFPLFLTQLKYPLPGPGGQGTAKARAFPLGYSPSCYHLYDPGATNL